MARLAQETFVVVFVSVCVMPVSLRLIFTLSIDSNNKLLQELFKAKPVCCPRSPIRTLVRLFSKLLKHLLDLLSVVFNDIMAITSNRSVSGWIS